ncbi:sulfite exporter TauE/SafE family protein [Sinorhizobium alkalisoli]|uniref:sulfite exporter TauE/SafE family protein n=1 Tax=Sinorhizobium alkalisoli TaxID=1752398 RepID=UPI0012A7ACAC|nr:sulfite exporter TauE/SafE family protein [Sinorhizobium alkalisoli]QFI68587.1 Heavy-metal-associated domain containing protein [Sinorhizobium alkalisoli]
MSEMTPYLVLFIAGFAGSFHCIGMCGGFACALGRDPHGTAATLARHLLYNSGRLTSYCFLGVLAGALGQAICTSTGPSAPLLDAPFDLAQRLLAIVAGVIMVIIGLQFFGLIKRPHPFAADAGGAKFASALRWLLGAPGRAAPLAFGVFNGLLPCPLVYAFLAQAASTAGALSGLMTMLAFGLGTVPAMFMMGGVGNALGPLWRRRGVRLAGSFILLLGLVTLGRGLLPAGLLHGEHLT